MKHIFGSVSTKYSSSSHLRSSCWFSSASLANPARILSCLLKRKKAWNQLYRLANEGIVNQWLPIPPVKSNGVQTPGSGHCRGVCRGGRAPAQERHCYHHDHYRSHQCGHHHCHVILIVIIIITCADSNQRRSTWGWRRDLWA